MGRSRFLLVLVILAAAIAILWVTLPGRPPEARENPAAANTTAGSTPAPKTRSSVSLRSAPAVAPAAAVPMAQPTPEMRALVELQFRTVRKNALRSLYADYFNTLKLPSAQQEQMVQVLVESELELLTQSTATMPPNPPSREWLAQHHANLEQKLQSVLGPENYTQFQNYQNSVPDRILVQALNQELGHSLNPDISGQLMQIFQEERQQVQAKRDAQSMDGLTREQINAAVTADMDQINQATLRRAATVLNPQQIEVLARVQEKYTRAK